MEVDANPLGSFVDGRTVVGEIEPPRVRVGQPAIPQALQRRIDAEHRVGPDEQIEVARWAEDRIGIERLREGQAFERNHGNPILAQAQQEPAELPPENEVARGRVGNMPAQSRADRGRDTGGHLSPEGEAQGRRQPLPFGGGEDEIPVQRVGRGKGIRPVARANAVQDPVDLRGNFHREEPIRPARAGAAWTPESPGSPRAAPPPARARNSPGDGPKRSPPSSSAWPGQRAQKREAAQLEHVCRSRIRIERTRSISGERCQISANGSSRTLPQAMGRATHGITSP